MTRRGLPGDPDDTHSRYIEAAIAGMIIGCLYLPNGNPAPGPKFDYKLRWFERLTSYAKTLLASGAPAVLAGDFTAMPTDLRQDAHLPLPKTPEGPMLPGNAAESGECRFSRTAFYSGKHALGAVRLPERAYLGCDSVC
jgi:hypothetical protein